MNIFLEGMPGSGKSTLLGKLEEYLAGAKAYREGDITPLELAWCAYMTQEQFDTALEAYPMLGEELRGKAERQGERIVVPYTQIATDAQGFYAYMEKYEIYGGRKSREEFERIVLQRFAEFVGDDALFECAFFQNIMDELLLFQDRAEDEVLDFYKKVLARVNPERFRLIRLLPRDLDASLRSAAAERVDDKGNRVWEQAMVDYVGASPWGKARGVCDFEGVMRYFPQRRRMEDAVLKKLLPAGAHIDLVSREYDFNALVDWLSAKE